MISFSATKILNSVLIGGGIAVAIGTSWYVKLCLNNNSSDFYEWMFGLGGCIPSSSIIYDI